MSAKQMLTIMAVADPHDCGGVDTAPNLMAAAANLRARSQQRLLALLPCGYPEEAVSQLARLGPDTLFRCIHPMQDRHPQEIALAGIMQLRREMQPAVILFCASPWGNEMAARTAARLGVSMLPGLIELGLADMDRYLQGVSLGLRHGLRCRQSLAGPRPWIATVDPAAFPAGEEVERAAETRDLAVDLDSKACGIEFVGAVPAPAGEMPSLERAQVVVAGGQGVGDEAGFAMLKDLAKLLGGALGCTLPPVEQGFMDRELMIGATGKMVQAKCYIGCGISGDAYHTAGMDKSEKIVVINSDAKAPFFKLADYGIVGDLHAVIPCLIEKLRH